MIFCANKGILSKGLIMSMRDKSYAEDTQDYAIRRQKSNYRLASLVYLFFKYHRRITFVCSGEMYFHLKSMLNIEASKTKVD